MGAYLRRRGNGHNLAIEPVDHRVGRADWRENPLPPKLRHAPQTRLAKGGDIGNQRGAFRAGHRQRPNLAALDLAGGRPDGVKKHLHLAAHQVGQRGREAPIVDVRDGDSRQCLETLVQQMHGAAGPDRARIDLRRFLLRVSDEFLHRARRHVGADDKHVAKNRDWRDRDEFIQFVAGILLHQHIDRKTVGGEQQRVAVRRGARDHAGADHGGGTALVFNDHRLTQSGGQGLCHETPHAIHATSRRVGNHNTDRFGGVGLRQRTGGGNT